MSKKQPTALTATTLRLVLLSAVVLLLVAQAGLTILGQQAITSYGQEVASAVALSSSDEKTLGDLQSVSTALERQKTVVEKSTQLVANKDDAYAYQDQIIQDINRYATLAGLKVTGFAFTEVASPTPAASATAPAAGSTSSAASAAGTPAGVTPVAVTLTLAESGSYDALYKFLQLIEGNLLRLEVTSLNLSRPTASDATASNSAGITSITIQVYTKK